MIDALIQWLQPAQSTAGEGDHYQIKDRRLLISYMLVIASAVGFFTILDFASGKDLSATINLIFWLLLALLIIAYRASGSYLTITLLMVTACQVLVGTQHLYAPPGLIANLFWPPLLTMMSVHLLGRSTGLKFGFASSAIVIAAAIVRPILALEGDPFTAEEIFQFHIISLTLTVIVGAYIAGRLATEVDVVFDRLELQGTQFCELYETNSALLSMVSHDINNHLTVATLLVDSLDDASSAGSASTRKQLAARLDEMSTLVEQTNSLSALRSGKLSIRRVPVPLTRALDECLRLFEPEIVRRQLTIDKHLPTDPKMFVVLAEPFSLVTNVLNNVVSNAIKFSPNNSTINISMENEGPTVLLCIADRGIGIPSDILPHLFDFHTPTTRVGLNGEKGTGFGLPILKMFMERYGASVAISSGATTGSDRSEGAGTKVSLRFQRRELDANASSA